MNAVSLLYLEVFGFSVYIIYSSEIFFSELRNNDKFRFKGRKEKMGREKWNCPKLTQMFSKLAIIFFLPYSFSEPDGRHFLASIFSISGICHVPNEYLIR